MQSLRSKYQDDLETSMKESDFCNLKFNMPNKNPVVFPNGSNYDYYLIIKELANEFEG